MINAMGGPTPSASNSPFLKQLASSSSRTRGEALDYLRQYLRTRTDLSPLEYLKLWKGLFYCVWHSDRPKAQQTLARELASLVLVLPNEDVTETWLRTFWETMAREWGGIPALRMNKFLYLCRCYIGAGFEWCKKEGWDKKRWERHSHIMGQIPLSTELERPDLTNGLRLHILDIWVDELEKCQGEGILPIELLIEPVQRLKSGTRDKTLRSRAMETLQDSRLQVLIGRVDSQDPSVGLETSQTALDKRSTRTDAMEEADEEWEGFDGD